MPYKTIEITNNSVVQETPQTSHFYKGFSSVDDSNLNTRLYDFNLVKQDILNHFKTKKNERLMNPSFGSVIWDLLMEPLTDQTRILLSEDIKNICYYDPRVVVEAVDIVEYPTGFIVEITLILKSTNQADNMKLKFDQEVGLTVL